MDLPSRPADRGGFHIAIICALTLESNAIDLLFDEIHDTGYGRAIGDNNTYTTGRVGHHAVVLLVLPNMGKEAAAAASAHLLSSFHNIKLALVVGICGGLPRIGDEEAFLGDVVISRSIVNYDFGRQYPDKFVVKSSVEDSLGRANKDIRGLLNFFDREHDLGVLQLKAVANLNRLQAAAVAKRRKAKYTMPHDDTDKLFPPDYQHAHRNKECDACAAHSMRFCEEASKLSCDVAGCDLSLHKPRQNRQQERPVELVPQIFIGKVASGNAVMKSGQYRDRIAEEHEIIAFEMEGAGAWDEVPCIVVKGICDYADSHKNKQWQNLAAATAASVAVGILAKYEVAGAATHNYHKEVGTNYYIPLSRNGYFVGRAEVLGRLEKKLFGEDDPPRVALVGLGGIGKTQVALQLAYLTQENKSGWSVFWVPALSMASFEQACVDIIGKLRVPLGEGEGAKDTFRRHFTSATAGKWLLIVDNADDWDTLFGQGNEGGINDYLPQSSGRILFTTRSRKVATNVARNNIIDLSEMSRGEAREFLEKSLVETSLPPENIVDEFLEELAHLPLAITQAAAYMNENQVSIAEYLGIFRNTDRDKVELLAAEFTDNTRYKKTQNVVARTWIISFEQIHKINADAAKLLTFAACVEPKAIPRSMLPSVGTEQRMTGAIGLLCGYAFLVKRGDGGMFDMHSLVHLAIREWVKGKGDTEKTMENALAQVAAVFPSDKWENRERWRQYMPHALKMLQVDGAARGGESEAMNRLRFWAGRCLRMDGRIREAVGLLEHVVAVRGRTLSEEHPDRLASQHVLAGAYEADGQVTKAVGLLEHVVAIRGKTLSEEHPDRLASQHVLAGAYEADGQVKKAVGLLEHVVAVEGRTLSEEHPFLLASQHELAGAYRADGQVREAVGLLEHVVAVEGRTLSEEHPDRLASQNALAGAYRADGQVKKAVGLLEHVVAVKGKTLSEEHPDRLASQNAFAGAYQADGQVKKAVDLLEHVVAIRGKTLSEKHPALLASQHELAGAYQADGQVKKAVDLLEHVVAIRGRTLSKEHPFLLASQHALAGSYQADGQVTKAIGLLEHVVAIRGRTLSEEHPSRLASQHELARAYEADGQVKKAVGLLEHAVAVEGRTLLEEHPDRLASQQVLARAYQADGQVTKAVGLLEHVVAVEERTLSEEHPDRLASQYALAGAYQADGQVTKAVGLLEHIVAVRGKTLSEKHPYRLVSQHVLAIAYLADGQVTKAVGLLEHVVAVEERTLSEEHPNRLASQHELAKAYRADGQITKAVGLLEHVVAIRKRTLSEEHPDRLASQHALARVRGKTFSE
ncbi:hypothetical protein RB595_004105 [Gaeumannomyces hyphopodioides]